MNAKRGLTAALAAALLMVPCASADAVQVTPADTPPPQEAFGFSPTVTFAVPKYELGHEEKELVAACLILEAASQGDRGMRGVMAVIRNRARGLPELFVPTILREKQFSALNKLTSGRESLWRVLRRAKSDHMWDTALRIVADATSDNWHDPTRGATHYTRTGEHTRWTSALAKTVVIGRHAFYR